MILVFGHGRTGLIRVSFVAHEESLVVDCPATGDPAPTRLGLGAQALLPHSRLARKLVDDYLIVNGRNSIHVCNAPSPAATTSLKIGEAMAENLLGLTA